MQPKTSALEAAATATTPIPAGVSGFVILGHTLADWVLVGTAFLLVFQLVVIIPKVLQTFRKLVRFFKDPSDVDKHT